MNLWQATKDSGGPNELEGCARLAISPRKRFSLHHVDGHCQPMEHGAIQLVASALGQADARRTNNSCGILSQKMSAENRIPPPLGVVRKYHRLAGVVLVQHEYPVLAKRDRHIHSWFHITLVQRGYYTRTHGAREEIYAPGTLSLLPNEDEHTDQYSPGSRCLHLAVIDLQKRLHLNSRTGSHCVSPLLAAHFCAALQHEFEYCDTDSELIIELLLRDMLSAHAGLCEARSAFQPSWLGRLLDYLDDTFTEPWTLNDLATQVGVHPVYLCRTFRQHFRFTLGQYIRSLRVLRAQQLVVEGSVNLAEVAVLSGFADQSHLQREFKKVVGTSPGLYRRVNGRAQS